MFPTLASVSTRLELSFPSADSSRDRPAAVGLQALVPAALGHQQRAGAVEQLPLQLRVAAGPLEDGAPHRLPEARLVEAVALAGHEHQPGGDPDPQRVVAGGVRGVGGGDQRLLAVLRPAHPLLQQPAQVERLRLQRPGAQHRGPGDGALRPLQRAPVVARQPERARLGQRGAHRLRLLARGRLAGQRRHARQRRHVRAGPHRGEPQRRVHRLPRRGVVRVGQQRGQALQLLQARVQALHADLERGLGLLAAERGRLAGVAVHRQPALGVGVQRRRRAVELAAAGLPAQLHHPGPERVAHLRAPGGRQQRGAAGAALGAGGPLALEAGARHQRHRHHRPGHGERRHPIPPLERRLQLGQQRGHGGEAGPPGGAAAPAPAPAAPAAAPCGPRASGASAAGACAAR